MIRGIYMMMVFTLLMAGAAPMSWASQKMGEGEHRHMMGEAEDKRTVLDVPPMMKEHQKKMMREHLDAVREITKLLGNGDFEKASEVVHNKLGLTDEMRRMCSMFGSDQFMQMGLAFHGSADELGETLKSKDYKQSMAALAAMLDNCVSCHNTFRH